MYMPSFFAICTVDYHALNIEMYFSLTDDNSPNFNEPNMTNMLLLSSFIVGAIYLLGSNGDPVPEITWNTFYREILTKGEVQYISQ